MTSFYAWIADLAQRGWLPSDFQYPFLIRGFLSVLVLAPILGGLSHLVVTRRMAFFSAALGQAALTGVAIGLVLAAVLSRSISTFLFGVQPIDPMTFVLVPIVLSARSAPLPVRVLGGMAGGHHPPRGSVRPLPCRRRMGADCST